MSDTVISDDRIYRINFSISERNSESFARWSSRSCYSCETWTLTGELRRRMNSFGTMSLRRILGYRWHDYISNDLVLREAGLRQVTCIVRERQLRLYGHVARLPAEDTFLPKFEGLDYVVSKSEGLDHAEGPTA